MARKSAKSKGYRKAAEKKPYLSKRDIIILCALVAVIAVGAVLLFSYDDGGLKTRVGKVVDAGENWLIVNGGRTGSSRYFKLGEAGEYPGFTRNAVSVVTDDNLKEFRYTPDAEGDPVRSVIVACAHTSAERLADYYAAMVSSLEPTPIAQTELSQGTARYFTYNAAFHVDEASEEAAEAPAEDAEVPAEASEAEAAETTEGEDADAEASEDAVEPNRFEQTVYVCMDAAHESAVSVSLARRAESEDDYLSEEELLALATQFIDGTITLEAEEAK